MDAAGFVFCPELLRSLLTFHKIRQHHLSRRLNRSQSYISNVLTGIVAPTTSEAETIARLVQASSVSDIFDTVREE